MKTYTIEIEGLVQGVGFRPCVYKLATSLGMEGSVENLNTGVRILLNCDNGSLQEFIEKLKLNAPLQSRIDVVNYHETEFRSFTGFSIVTSSNLSNEVTIISPDIAVCSDCLMDMAQQPHRTGYPLINCTNCGPRFSIIRGVPYDRTLTTMDVFAMCPLCSAEYHDVGDRRFHAQPVACNNCGPVYSMSIAGQILTGTDDICSGAASFIDEGGVVSIKGTGGYHLVCDAFNETAVSSLRAQKLREGKPFAVMCRNIEIAGTIAQVNNRESESLSSWQRPVLILEGLNKVAPSVSNGLSTVGVILPYMPFHYLLFSKLKTDVVVFTSANVAEEPVIIDDQAALSLEERVSGATISYNREIHNRTDDSVGKCIGDDFTVFRRSRGFAPLPVLTSMNTEGIFGAGAELSNCFAIGKGRNVIMSQHIGDLRNYPTLGFYKTSLQRFSEMFRFVPRLIARDIHPDYLSSVFADEMAMEKQVPVIMVQHHHAHIASCMAENGVNGSIIGVSMDGVGLGTDGKIWGGEFMVADFSGFERVAHFDYVAVAGGDSVSFEPWRSGVSWLIRYGVPFEEIMKLPVGIRCGAEKVRLYSDLVEKGINTADYSSAGRLFDAVAAITGLNHESSFHAEAPMRLESAIKEGINRSYDFDIDEGVISFGRMISSLVTDIMNGRQAGEISAMFHNCVANAIVAGVEYASGISGLKEVALSGGTFQNKYLTEMVMRELLSRKFIVYYHRNIPPNDGGLALGQVMVAAALGKAGKRG